MPCLATSGAVTLMEENEGKKVQNEGVSLLLVDMGGQGMDCEWLAGLVWEGLGDLGMDCKWLAVLVSRACQYVDCMDGRGWEVWGWAVNIAGLVWEGLGCVFQV